jgi:hypothetical protein
VFRSRAISGNIVQEEKMRLRNSEDSSLCTSYILPNVFYDLAIKVPKFIESTRQHETLISVAP